MTEEDEVIERIEAEAAPTIRRCGLWSCRVPLPDVPDDRRGRRPNYCSVLHKNRASRERIAAEKLKANGS